jgi:thiol-disulfide isomerase/thioredoxin
MGKGITLLVLGLLLGCNGTVSAQPSGSELAYTGFPLKIGDPVPDVAFDEVMNYSAAKARLSDFRGKLTILDFWASPCSGCISFFTHLQKIQDEFNGTLKIVLVDAQASKWHDDQAKVARALESMEEDLGEKINMPVVLNSPQLYEAFPYTSIPHEVWIDSLGKVMAITDAYAVTRSNVQDVIAGRKVSFPVKTNIQGDPTKQTLLEMIKGAEISNGAPLLNTCVYKGYLSGLSGSGMRRDDSGRLTGYYVFNEQLLEIYGAVFRETMGFYPFNEVVVEASHPERFSMTYSFDSLENAQSYSFDVTTGPTTYDSMMRLSQGELNNIFHTRVFKARRRVRCLVLGFGGNADTATDRVGKPLWVTDLKDSLIRVHNFPLQTFALNLNTGGVKLPVIWDSVYSGRVNCTLPNDFSNKALLLNYLRNAGFAISEEYRELNVVVIADQ